MRLPSGFASKPPLVIVACVAIALFVVGGVVSTTDSFQADRLSGRIVLAEVHPWGATLEANGYYARWNETGHDPTNNDITSTVWPARGLESMSDCEAIGRMGADLALAGVDVAVIDWVDVYRDEASRVGNILSCIATKAPSMRAAVMVDIEPGWHPETWEAVQARFHTMLWWANTPPFRDAYYRDLESGLPLYFVFDPGGVATIDAWNNLLSYAKHTPGLGGIFVASVGEFSPLHRQWNNAGLDHVTRSLFDGVLVSAGKNKGIYDPDDATSSDVQNHQWALWQVHGQATSRGQMVFGQVVPGFNTTANCHDPNPIVVDRENGAVYDRKWAHAMSVNYEGRGFDAVYTVYHNDGEDAGIAPISNDPPVRGAGYADCGGRLGSTYTVSEVPERYYLHVNRHWSMLFRYGGISALDATAPALASRGER